MYNYCTTFFFYKDSDSFVLVKVMFFLPKINRPVFLFVLFYFVCLCLFNVIIQFLCFAGEIKTMRI